MLDDLGWKINVELSDESYNVYEREDESLSLDFDKRKITYTSENTTEQIELSFATLNAILELVKVNAIF